MRQSNKKQLLGPSERGAISSFPIIHKIVGFYSNMIMQGLKSPSTENLAGMGWDRLIGAHNTPVSLVKMQVLIH